MPSLHALLKIWRIIKYPVLLGILAFIISQCGPVLDYVGTHGVDYIYLLLAAAIFQIGVFLLSYRLQLLLKCAGVLRDYSVVLRAYLESVPYYFISPSGLGLEMARYYKLKPEQGEKSATLVTLLIDRAAGVLGACFLALLGWRTLLQVANMLEPLTLMIVGAIICLLGGAVLILLYRNQGIQQRIKTILSSYRLYKGSLIIAVFLSVAIQLTIGLTTYYIARAFGLEPDLYSLVWVSATGMILIIVPASILGFNLLDLPTAYIYTLAGFNLSDATFLILVAYLLRVWLAIQGGVLDLLKKERDKIVE